MLPNTATIVEVGPRDGLQNEDDVLATEAKVELIHRLVAAGVRRVETTSFVHPGLVPQMADAEAVMSALGPSDDGVSYIGLVLNRRGLDRALGTPIDEVNFSVAASDGFSASNQGTPVEAAMSAIEAMIPEAKAAGKRTTVTISVVWGCPFDGEVPIEAVARLVERSVAAGVDEIALGDTIGVAVPAAVTQRLGAVRPVVGEIPLRVHFHDTRNTAIANVYAALTVGVSTIDASVGGAGGCPFAPNATGNVPTEDVLYMLDRSGIATGLDMQAVADIGRWLGGHLSRQLPAAIGKAGGFPG
ncbi:MAG: hydroxymethylglutaryl-CoA lyase [bacterium]|nr:hydroxymethylglutaryl-CoA lyase [bacterium]